jgi:HD-GYP domain-containing protein (c-di-GMP phosphodiesterase class II)
LAQRSTNEGIRYGRDIVDDQSGQEGLVDRPRLMRLDQARGRVLGEGVRNGAGQALLRAGATLSPRYVRSLASQGFTAVYVEDPVAPGIPAEDSLRWETRAPAFTAVREIFEQAAAGEIGSVAGARTAVSAIPEDVTRTASGVFALTALRAASEYAFTHSVHVCALSLLVGVGAGYDRTALQRLGVGTLLLDVGAVASLEAAEKPGALTDAEWELVVRRHPVDGYEMLRRDPEVCLFSAHVAFQHHERADAGGYPRRIYGERILPFAAIAAVADVYDAMTSDRPYRPAQPPPAALQWLHERAGTQFDREAVRRLVRRLAAYPAGTIVRLTSGEVGAVQAQGKSPHLPQVRIVADAALRRVEPEPAPLDLGAEGERRRVGAVLADWTPERDPAASG